MANIKNIQEYGNSLAVFLDDGSRVLCHPTPGGLWLPAVEGGSVTPPEPEEGFKWPFAKSQHSTYEGHSGIDWSKALNTRIRAIGPGTVNYYRDGQPNRYGSPIPSSLFVEPIWRGNCIVINHGTIGSHEIWSLYAHMNGAPLVNLDDTVVGGQVIGKVGSSGASSGNHLHFEVIYDGVRLQSNQGGYERAIEWMDANAVGVWT